MTKNPFLTPEEIKDVAGYMKTAFIATHKAWLVATRTCFCARLNKDLGRVAREIDDCRKEILLDIETHNGSCTDEEINLFSLNDWVKEAEGK